ncbi:hypothetical protein MTR67_031395 [Solanum verrucosum]|uniref:Integrase core domain containing protein n=1 Tax=Solanum verrucosum TaxID=315347 RepID=A0AAF0U2D6_SOLVR|nr:hypothetical protein MTR67_031395 [Solanum verrucosum]
MATILQHMRPWMKRSIEESKLARLRVDVDAFAATTEDVPEPTCEVEADDMMLSALFGDKMSSLDPPCG